MKMVLIDLENGSPWRSGYFIELKIYQNKSEALMKMLGYLLYTNFVSG